MTSAKPLTPLVRDFKAARFCSVPLIAVETPDPAATLAVLTPVMPEAPIAAWDIVRGVYPVNAEGQQMLAALQIQGGRTINPVTALEACANLPQFAAVAFFNLHLHLRDPGVIQALWNLRDLFKQNRRTIVLLGISCELPPELGGDVILLDQPLPTRKELEPILDAVHTDAELPKPTGLERARMLDAIVGLAPFTAEQNLALSLEGPKSATPGIVMDRLWERKCRTIKDVPGLSVWRGGESFDDLRGVDSVKDFLQGFVDADAFGAVVFIDEMEKALAGAMSEYTGDSGVAKDQNAVLLAYLNDTDADGVMLAGEAGTGKSALAKATGAAAGKVTIALDLGALKGGTVGQSERQIRYALKVITAIAEGRVLFIATANNTTSFSPEVNRRFPDQFYFESPDDAGRAAIWPVYINKFKLTAEQAAFPKGMDVDWTGAEIRRVCRRAAKLKRPVVDVAKHVLPQAISQKHKLQQQREAAAGRFLSANRPGWYAVPSLQVSVPATPPVVRRHIKES
jgi:hypothetical protein